MAQSPARQDSLAKCFRGESDVRLLGKAASFPVLKSLIGETPSDVALIESPETQSANAQEWLSELMELIPVVLLSPEADPGMFNRIRKRGPGALLRSTSSCEQIVFAVKSVASGLTVFDSAAMPEPTGDEVFNEALTPREAEVLQLLADGSGNREIAARLGISEHTIKFHIRSILGKLGAASRTDAVARGLRSGLIEL